jgi:hypothetical protein
MQTFNNGDKAKQHYVFDRSVYSGLNKCTFVPNCAFEREYINEVFPNGLRVCIYQSDSGQHMRAVLFKNTKVLTGFCGLLFEVKTGRIVYGECNPADRGQGNYKQLRAIVPLLTKVKLWSDFQSAELLKAAHIYKEQ